MLRTYVFIGLIAAAAAATKGEEKSIATKGDDASTTPDGTTDAPTTDEPKWVERGGTYVQVFYVTVKMEGKCADFDVDAAAEKLAAEIKVDKGLVTVTKSCADRRRLEDAKEDAKAEKAKKEPKPERFTVSAQIGPVVDEEAPTTGEVETAAGNALDGDGFKVTSVVKVTSKGRVIFPPMSPPSPAPSPPPSPSPSPPCLDADGCFDYGGPKCHAASTKCSMWDADTGTHGPTKVEEVEKFGPYTCCDAGYICAPGGLNGEEGVFGGKTCTAEECKYWSCKPRAAGLASIEAYKALKDDAEKEEDDDEDPPCVDNLDAKKDGKYKKKFCNKKKAQGKCDSKPRFMKKVCSKTCGFCTAAEGEGDKDGDKEPVAPPACENTPGKKKRNRGLDTWCDNKSTKNQGKSCGKKKIRKECCATCEEKSDKWCANGEVHRAYETYGDSGTYGTLSSRASTLKKGEKFLGVPGVVALCACKDDYACSGEGCYDLEGDILRAGFPGPIAVKGPGYSASCPDCTCEKK